MALFHGSSTNQEGSLSEIFRISEWASTNQDPIQVTSEIPLHTQEATEPLALTTTTPEPLTVDPSQLAQPQENIVDESFEFQFQPLRSAFNHFRYNPFVPKPTKLATKPTKLIAQPIKPVAQPAKAVLKSPKIVAQPTKVVLKPTKLVAQQNKIVNKPNKLIVAKSYGKVFPNAYVNLDSFFRDNNQNYNYAKQYGFYGW